MKIETSSTYCLLSVPPMSQQPKLKDILCSNPNCRRLLAHTDGKRMVPINTSVLTGKLTDRKKKFNSLYCVVCKRITRSYKSKFQSKIKKLAKFANRPPIGKDS